MTLELECIPSRRDRKRAETRDRIHDAAMCLIGEFGFDHVTVEMITERADVAKGTFFNYFTNKESVVEDFFQSQMEVASETIASLVDADPPLRPWELINKVIHVLANRDTRTKNLTRALLALSLTNPEVRAACHKTADNGKELGRFLVAQAQEAGEVRSDLTPDQVSNLIISIYFGVLRDWACDMTESDDVHLELDRRLKLIYEGLRS